MVINHCLIQFVFGFLFVCLFVCLFETGPYSAAQEVLTVAQAALTSSTLE
ncbi:hypothetical protein ACRRTK_003191 [Alexandromys fortis]